MVPFPPVLMYQIISFTLSECCVICVASDASMKVLINESMTPRCVKYISTSQATCIWNAWKFTPKLVQKVSWKKGEPFDPRNKQQLLAVHSIDLSFGVHLGWIHIRGHCCWSAFNVHYQLLEQSWNQLLIEFRKKSKEQIIPKPNCSIHIVLCTMIEEVSLYHSWLNLFQSKFVLDPFPNKEVCCETHMCTVWHQISEYNSEPWICVWTLHTISRKIMFISYIVYSIYSGT